MGSSMIPDEVTTDAAGSVYVVDQLNHRIQKFTGTGTYVTQWGSFGNGDGQFNAPNGVEVDAAGDVYVADTFNHRIQKFTGTGTYLTQWGSQGSGNGEFLAPVGMATDAAGNLYVADNGNHRIQKFGPAPTPAITIAFDLKPNTLNLASQGQWVTGFLEPPSPLRRERHRHRVHPAERHGAGRSGDSDRSGRPRWQRRPGPDGEVQPIGTRAERVSGAKVFRSSSPARSGAIPSVGTDHIRVIRAVVSAPVAGSHLAGGSGVTEVRWQMPSGIAIRRWDCSTHWTVAARGT